MANQTFTLPNPPKILPGKEVYDSIMKQIEPDLLSDNLPKLKEQHKNEIKEEKEKRRVRYNKAFAKYYQMYAAYIADLDMRIKRFHRSAMTSIEELSRSGEELKLEALESDMFKLS